MIMKTDFTQYLSKKPQVQGFFDVATNTISYVVTDPDTKHCAIIDSVMDFDQAGGSISFESADAIINYVTKHELTVQWVLETHVHADHLSAAPYLKEKLGGTMAIGKYIVDVQNIFTLVGCSN